MPCSRSARSSIRPAVASSWRSISRSARCTTVTAIPRLATARAASSPSSPPPITTARRAPFVRPRIVRTSWRVRNAIARSMPSIGGSRAREPVASTSASYGESLAAGGDGDDARVDVDDLGAGAQLDPALAVPAAVVQRQVGRLAVAGEVVGEPDAVVRQPGLGADERDAPVAVGEHRLGRRDAGRAGADDRAANACARRGAPAPARRAPRIAFSPGWRETGSVSRCMQVVDAAGAGGSVQRAPVKRRERGALAQRLVEAHAQRDRAAARDDARPLAVAQPGAARVGRVQLEERLRLGLRSAPTTCRCASSCATGSRSGRWSARAGGRRPADRRGRPAAPAASRGRPDGVWKRPSV